MVRKLTAFFFVILTLSWAGAQEYQPKFKGDPAKSDSEAAALGFMRTIVAAEKIYHGRHNAYTTSLQALAGTGSVTRRTVGTNKRGDYTVHYHGTTEKYELSMTPDQMDATHRSFYVDQNGKIKGDDSKPATEESPEV